MNNRYLSFWYYIKLWITQTINVIITLRLERLHVNLNPQIHANRSKLSKNRHNPRVSTCGMCICHKNIIKTRMAHHCLKPQPYQPAQECHTSLRDQLHASDDIQTIDWRVTSEFDFICYSWTVYHVYVCIEYFWD